MPKEPRKKSRFEGGKQPLLNFIKTTIETIVEADKQAPAVAFVDNAVSYSGVLWNYKGLIEDLKEVKKNPALLEELEQIALEDLEEKSDNIRLKIIFRHVWMSLIFTTNSMITMTNELKELEPKAIRVEK